MTQTMQATFEPVSGVVRTQGRLVHPSDAAELRWYFRCGGLSMFSTSSFGKQLDRAAMFCFGGHTCEKCEGGGFVPSKPDVWRKTTEHQADLLRLVGIEPTELIPPLADRVCGACKGMGWIAHERRHNARAAQTARLTGSSKRGRAGGVDVGDVSLARLGAVSGRLARVPPGHVAALELFYAPSGGALVALYELTSAGKTLLRRNSQKLSPRQFFENESEAERALPNVQRGKLLSTAEGQASEIHRVACDAWEATRRPINAEAIRERALALLAGEGL